MDKRKVSDVMRRSLLAVSKMTPVEEAAILMAESNVGSVIVMEKGAVIGICTERDILTKVVARGIPPGVASVDSIMTRAPYVVSPDEPFVNALLLMSEGNFRHLPVVCSTHGLIGMVSARDAISAEIVSAERMSLLKNEIAEIL